MSLPLPRLRDYIQTPRLPVWEPTSDGMQVLTAGYSSSTILGGR